MLFAICLVASTVPASAAEQDRTSEGEVRQHAERAREALIRNDWSAAEHEYRAILEIEPTNASVYTALGVALYGAGKVTEAVPALEKALELDLSQSGADLFLGLSESELGACEKAVPTLIKYFPTETDAKLRRLAGLSLLNCQRSSADAAAALETVQKLRQMYPDDADVLYQSAELYTRLWNEAAGKLIEEHSESYRVHQLAGEVFEAQGNFDRAIKEFRLALQKSPRIPEVHFRIGQLLIKQNNGQDKAQALEEFRQELAVDPRSAAAENAIGDTAREKQDLNEAIQHYRRAIELDTRFAQPHIGLAQVFLARHDAESARHELELATRLEPENATAHYNLMLAYRSQGKLEDAQREMAIFEKLDRQSSQTFENKLHSLMSGPSIPEAARK